MNGIILCMLKKCLMLLLLGLTIPACAGEVENAIAKGDNVFLYLHSPSCKYCVMFSPRYNKLSKVYNGQYSFFKVDTTTKYGHELMYEFGGTYVPYKRQKESSNAYSSGMPFRQCMPGSRNERIQKVGLV